MRKYTRRAVVGVALGLAMVMATASSAGAVWTAPWYITDPTKLIIGTTEFDFGDPTETDCPELPDQALGIDMQGDDEKGTWTASGAVWDEDLEEWIPGPIKARFHLPPPNETELYQADITILAATGEYQAGATHNHPVDPPHPANEPNYDFSTTGPNHITARVDIYELEEPDCEKDNLVCTIQLRMASEWGYGYIFDAPNHTPPGDWIQMALSTDEPGGIRPVAVGGNCAPQIAAFVVGAPVAFAPITGLDP